MQSCYINYSDHTFTISFQMKRQLQIKKTKKIARKLDLKATDTKPKKKEPIPQVTTKYSIKAAYLSTVTFPEISSARSIKLLHPAQLA